MLYAACLPPERTDNLTLRISVEDSMVRGNQLFVLFFSMIMVAAEKPPIVNADSTVVTVG